MEWRVISIGTLASHPLWNERGGQRVSHTTTTVVKSDGAVVLVDPSLPPNLVNARLNERWGLELTDVTHVFLTSFDPDRRRTLCGLEHATWFMHEPEIQSASAAIQDELHRAESDPAVVNILNEHLGLLAGFISPEDKPFSAVDLFPIPGFTPGSCGLLLPLPKQTILIAGDTVATQEHLEKGSVLQNCADIEIAKESFLESVEIADIIIPGRDNVILNPARAQ
jgi:glyoxylase-like metal-dependent hydrolase (beta-lactamase superfamily II)